MKLAIQVDRSDQKLQFAHGGHRRSAIRRACPWEIRSAYLPHRTHGHSDDRVTQLTPTESASSQRCGSSERTNLFSLTRENFSRMEKCESASRAIAIITLSPVMHTICSDSKSCVNLQVKGEPRESAIRWGKAEYTHTHKSIVNDF